MKKLKSGVIPLLASPQRGGGCVFNRISRSHRSRRSRGGFPFVLNRKTTPASRQRRLRDILLIARPPLLCRVESSPISGFHFKIKSPQQARGLTRTFHPWRDPLARGGLLIVPE